jgi:hypothetical protein
MAGRSADDYASVAPPTRMFMIMRSSAKDGPVGSGERRNRSGGCALVERYSSVGLDARPERVDPDANESRFAAGGGPDEQLLASDCEGAVER